MFRLATPLKVSRPLGRRNEVPARSSSMIYGSTLKLVQGGDIATVNRVLVFGCKNSGTSLTTKQKSTLNAAINKSIKEQSHTLKVQLICLTTIVSIAELQAMQMSSSFCLIPPAIGAIVGTVMANRYDNFIDETVKLRDYYK